jgi:hypothetical protein
MNQRMKKLILWSPLWAILLASAGMAQTSDVQSVNDLPQPIAAARCRYIPGAETCAELAQAHPSSADSTDNATLAQLPRRMPGPPMRSAGPMPYPRSTYASPWMGEHGGRRALIGALIGGGLGVAIGSKGTGGASAMAIFGMIGAGIGAGVGMSLSPVPIRYPYRRSWHDPYQDATRSKPASSNAKTASMASTQRTPPAELPDPQPTVPASIVFNDSGTP